MPVSCVARSAESSLYHCTPLLQNSQLTEICFEIRNNSRNSFANFHPYITSCPIRLDTRHLLLLLVLLLLCTFNTPTPIQYWALSYSAASLHRMVDQIISSGLNCSDLLVKQCHLDRSLARVQRDKIHMFRFNLIISRD